MKLEVLASGSRGNSTAVKTGENIVLLDAGLKFHTLQWALRFKLPTAVLITHEHSDHAKVSTVKELLNRGVEVYMTSGTADVLGLGSRHNLKILRGGEAVEVNAEVLVAAIANEAHDSVEAVNYAVRLGGEWVWYITDSGYLDPEQFYRLPSPTKLVIEANYDEERLKCSAVDAQQKRRIESSHLSAEQAVEFVEGLDKRLLEAVYLIHVSSRHGNGVEYKRWVSEVVPERVEVRVGVGG